MVTVLGESKPRVKNILTLGSCAAIVGAEVRARVCASVFGSGHAHTHAHT
jgi:hypothetical protein